MEKKEPEFRAAFDRMLKSKSLADGDVRVPQRMFVGIRHALHRRNNKLLGQWIDLGASADSPDSGGKTIRFDWTTKREAFPVLAPNAHRSYLETFPIIGAADDITTPYSKDIGGIASREVERLAVSDQPDWVQWIEPGELS